MTGTEEAEFGYRAKRPPVRWVRQFGIVRPELDLLKIQVMNSSICGRRTTEGGMSEPDERVSA